MNISSSEVNTFFAKLSSEYMIERNKEALEKVKTNFGNPVSILNYLPTFLDLLENTLRQIDSRICILISFFYVKIFITILCSAMISKCHWL